MDFKEEMRRQGSSIPTQPFITGAIDEIHMSQLLDKCMIDLEQLTAVERLVGESQTTAEYPKAGSQNRWEAERKRRQNVLALEEKKLVLRRKKIQRVKTWHRGGRYRRSARRASSTKSSRLTTRQGASTEVSSDEVKLCRN